MTKKVAIIVDDIVRDLIPLTLLAIELHRKKLKPYLVPARLQVIEIRKIKPDFIIINYLRKENEEIVKYYKDSGIAVGLLDQEGGAFIDYQKFEEIKLSKNVELRNSIDLVFAWGENFYNEAKKRLWFKEDSLIITGHPKYDIYFKKNKQTNKKAEKFLFITGFTLGNPRLQTKDKELKTWVKMGGDFNYVKELQNNHEVSYLKFLNLLENIFTKYSDKEFLLKIHPFENSDEYFEKFKKYQNVEIIINKNVINYLPDSKIMFHSSSTTAFESILYNIPTVNINFLDNPFDIEILNNISINLKSQEELETLLETDDYELLQNKTMESKEIIRNYFGDFLGYSSKLIAENIFVFLKYNEIEINENINKNQLVTSITNSKTLLTIKKLLFFIGIPEDFSFRRMNSQYTLWKTEEAKYFNKNTLINFLKNFDLEFDLNSFIKVEKKSVSLTISNE